VNLGPLKVTRHRLFVPAKLSDLATMIEETLTPHFQTAQARVVPCPDLTKKGWQLASKGISGSNKLFDIGGEHHQVKKYANKLSFTLEDIAGAAGLTDSRSYFLGAAAAPRSSVGCNGELIPIDNLIDGVRLSKLATVNETDPTGLRVSLSPYHSSEMGFLANLMSSEGSPGQVIEVRAKVRLGDECASLTDCIREGLAEKLKGMGLPPLGLGGVFKVVSGQVKTHVMKDTGGRHFHHSSEVQEYLEIFTMGPDLVCTSVFLTGEPSDAPKRVRLEHTHLFKTDLQKGGHYHGDVTPDEIEYVGYFVPNEELLVVDRDVEAVHLRADSDSSSAMNNQSGLQEEL